jgi:hypothetical protein
MSPQYTCPSLCAHHVSVYFSSENWKSCLTVWIIGALHTVYNTMRSSGRAGIKTMPIAVAPRCFTGYKDSFHLALLLIQHFFTFSSRVFSLPLHLFKIEEKRGTKRSCSLASGSSSSSSGASTQPPSPSGSPLPLGSPLETSSFGPPSPVQKHVDPSEEILMVVLSSDEEEGLPIILRDEEFA